MAVKEIIQFGDSRLKAENKRIEDFENQKVKELIQDLTDTMRERTLVGISAPQIGENYQMFITEIKKTEFRTNDQIDELRVCINPEIISLSKEESVIYEGCGSVKNGSVFAAVSRPKRVIIEATDENGKNFQIYCDGLLARVIQHEYDHLQGIEFIERVKDEKDIVSRKKYLEEFRTSKEQAEASVIHIKEIKTN
jgi:peptide deformylase